jgi:hypothetical protein
LFIIAGVGVLGVIGLIAIIWSETAHHEQNGNPAAAPQPRRDAAWEPLTAEDRVCEQFMNRRAAGDIAAADLLGRVPEVPEEPFATEGELERMQADFYLRDSGTKVISVSHAPSEDGPPRYYFKTQGNVTPPRLPIQRPKEVERWGRLMVNVKALVEVRDGKLFGIRGEWDRNR